MVDQPQTTPVTQGRLFNGADLLIALGALTLAVSLFLDWYGIGFDEGITAWTAFEVIDILLAALALAALIAVGESLIAGRATPQVPTWVRVVCGPIALVIVTVSLIDEPPAAGGAAATLEVGGWIAFAGAGLMTIGALLNRFRIAVVVGARERRAAADPGAETQRIPVEPR